MSCNHVITVFMLIKVLAKKFMAILLTIVNAVIAIN